MINCLPGLSTGFRQGRAIGHKEHAVGHPGAVGSSPGGRLAACECSASNPGRPPRSTTPTHPALFPAWFAAASPTARRPGHFYPGADHFPVLRTGIAKVARWGVWGYTGGAGYTNRVVKHRVLFGSRLGMTDGSQQLALKVNHTQGASKYTVFGNTIGIEFDSTFCGQKLTNTDTRSIIQALELDD